MDPNWITITESDLLALDVAPLIEAARTAALAQAQGDPLPPTIAAVTDLVRGYAAKRYRLGVGATIPARLQTAAVDIMIYRLLGRINRAGSKWEKRANAAMALLSDVASGDFALVDPAEADAAQGGRVPPRISSPRESRFTQSQQDGI